jgi:hypothetical protein
MKFAVKMAAIALFIVPGVLQAQPGPDSVIEKTKIQYYVNLYHQHHDFFGKAFSYQGLESGPMINRNLIIGLYGSCFVTNLKTQINNNMQNIWIGQAGIVGGYLYKSTKRVHPGTQLNAGIFSLRTDDNDLGLFDINHAAFKLNGLVLSPQLFGELNITDWFKVRIGMSYNIYSYKDHSVVKTSDLNHLSFTFGLFFVTK